MPKPLTGFSDTVASRKVQIEGGKARAKKLTKKERAEIARRAAAARWGR